MELNTIYKEDCLVGMDRIADNSVDLILCDLPYGVLKAKNNPHTAWDVQIDSTALWKQYKRILKPRGVIVLTATQPFATDLINSNRKMFKYEMIWCKSRASGFLNAKKQPSRSHENILVFYSKQPTYNPQKYDVVKSLSKRRKAKITSNSKSKAFAITNKDYVYIDNGTRYPDSLLEFGSTFRKGMHPTEKPIDLFAWLVRTYTEEGDLVLDNCMGSGTTALACLIEKRNFIGFETNQGYFDMANERIELTKKWLKDKK